MDTANENGTRIVLVSFFQPTGVTADAQTANIPCGKTVSIMWQLHLARMVFFSVDGCNALFGFLF